MRFKNQNMFLISDDYRNVSQWSGGRSTSRSHPLVWKFAEGADKSTSTASGVWPKQPQRGFPW